MSRWLPAFGVWLALFGFAVASSPTGCGSVAGFCAKKCSKAADCCPEGATNCPGPYPLNFACDDGLCKAPQCTKDADCAAIESGLICRSVDGFTGCARSCETNADCTEPKTACTGRSDDGARICVIDPCVTDADCGSLHCQSNHFCGCNTDAECGGGKNKCIGGTCGCGADGDCQPGLDSCTSDPAFRYPKSASAAPAP